MATNVKKTMGPNPKPIADRLRAKIAQLNGCWVYQGYVQPNGYGKIGVRHGKNDTRSTLVHRVAYEAFVGKIPKGLTIDHLCRTKLCVNPKHLEAVPQKINNFRAPNYVGNRTHCPSGHEYTANNTSRYLNHRRCLACHATKESIRRYNMKWRIAS